MRKSSWLLLGLAAAAVTILAYVYWSHPQSSTPASPSAAPKGAAPAIPPGSLTSNRRAGADAALSDAQQLRAGQSDRELIGVSEAVRAYRGGLGENPIGTNAEITKALTGGNSRQANFGGDNLTIKQ